MNPPLSCDLRIGLKITYAAIGKISAIVWIFANRLAEIIFQRSPKAAYVPETRSVHHFPVQTTGIECIIYTAIMQKVALWAAIFCY